MGAVEAVAVDEAADTTHGPEGIGELMVQELCRIKEKTQLMTPETCTHLEVASSTKQGRDNAS